MDDQKSRPRFLHVKLTDELAAGLDIASRKLPVSTSDFTRLTLQEKLEQLDFMPSQAGDAQ